MTKVTLLTGVLAGLTPAAMGCGQDASSSPSFSAEHDATSFRGLWTRDSAAPIAFVSTGSGPLAGAVHIDIGALTYEVHYDFEAREVVADGQDGALDRPTQQRVREASADVASYLAAHPEWGSDPGERGGALMGPMLYASLVLLADSGGMPLTRQVFRLAPAEVEKSLGNDGVTCIERGSTYGVSFDAASSTTLEALVTADAEDCNGRCGPGCTALTPWTMWTLDCLEHDTCCGATGDPACWTPLGQCGDEYVHAELDFLRGFDPLSPHCGG